MKVNEGLSNVRDLARGLGVDDALRVDAQEGPGVDFAVDFSLPADRFAAQCPRGPFATVAILNVLEHTFDPVTVLANALSLVRPGGTLLTVVLTIWPIHNYPIDCLRFNPDWFRQFAGRHGIELLDEQFCWLSEDFGLILVRELRRDELDYLPSFWILGRSRRPWRYRLTIAVN